ncbi:prepilin-type N-terminal cleavage/methylation domain-containing protein [Chitinibacter sp. SCUT-21]|uniref:type IV pilus modification PilV family protein n=1 Tax=Chitinibacter sp. SCUT-21 TaxID=2970891 RepID=UPI0035A5D74C
MKKNLGFSLLEILITVIILAVTALFLAKLNGITNKGTTHANERQVATRTAEGIMESLRQQARSRAPLSSTPILNGVTFTRGAGANPLYTGSFNGQTSSYTAKLSFNPSPNWTTDNSTFSAQVQISWKDRTNQDQNVVLVSSIYLAPLAGNDVAAPAMPSSQCRWSGNKDYLQGRYIIQEGAGGLNNSPPARGKSHIYYCTAESGCPKVIGPHRPADYPGGKWKYIGEFAVVEMPPGNAECKD